MELPRNKQFVVGWALAAALMSNGVALAASSFSNSLTGFTGDSTQPGTQATVGAAGFNFFSIEGLDASFTMDPTVVFSTSGASFGSLFAGDGGRNYMRTNDSDYATVPFVAEITFDITPASQIAVFGMGSGNTALFGIPDWSTLVASTFVQPELSGGMGFLTTFRTQNDANEFVNHPAPAFADGTHRLQMTFDPTARTMVYAIDLNYAGGAFTADVTAPTVDLDHIDCPVGCGFPEMPISADFFAPDGWPSEPSRIYFGGDDSVTFRDFSVVVSSVPMDDADFDDDGDVDGRDFVIWQRGFGTGTTNAMGDANGSGTVDGADLAIWQSQYNGGALAAASVPEPSSALLLTLASIWGLRRSARRSC